MADTAATIDLNAARRETKYPNGISVPLGDNVFVLPSQLPLEVLDPWLDERLDLVGVIRAVMQANQDSEDGDEDADLGDAILELLGDRPTLLRDLWAAVWTSMATLFEEEQYAAFRAERPGFGDLTVLVSGLWRMYGASLGEAFASPASSKSGGATPKPTSKSTTASTRARSGTARAKPATSSGSAG